MSACRHNFRRAGSLHNFHHVQSVENLSEKKTNILRNKYRHKFRTDYCQYHSLGNTFLFLASCHRAIRQRVKQLPADGQWKVNRGGFPRCWKLSFFLLSLPFQWWIHVSEPSYLSVTPYPSLPPPVFLLSLKYTRTLSHTKEGKCHYGNKEARFLKATSWGES